MPVFNRDEYLASSINSVLNQTLQDFEFIIIDDGSSLQTKELLRLFAEGDPRIKVLTNLANKGIAFSRNYGNSLAKGKYIAVMDSDDVCVPNRFEMQVQFLDENPEIALVGSQVLFINSKGDIQREYHYPLSPGLIRWSLLFNCPLCHPSVMMRRSLFSEEDYQYNKVPPVEDYDLFVRLSNSHKFANLGGILLYYRRHDKNFSKIQQKENLQQVANIIRKQIFDLLSLEVSDTLISGLIDSKNLTNTHYSIKLSQIIIKLLKKVNLWDISLDDHKSIQRAGAFKLRSIWDAQKHNVSLLPYVLYSVVLDSTVIIRKANTLFRQKFY